MLTRSKLAAVTVIGAALVAALLPGCSHNVAQAPAVAPTSGSDAPPPMSAIKQHMALKAQQAQQMTAQQPKKQ